MENPENKMIERFNDLFVKFEQAYQDKKATRSDPDYVECPLGYGTVKSILDMIQLLKVKVYRGD